VPATLAAQSQAASSGPGAGPIIRRSRIQHLDFLPDGATAIDRKSRYVSGVESVVDLPASSNQNKKP
jgi:hypothetical protein